MMRGSQWVEGRIGFLQAELAVTPEQEEAFSGLADSLRTSAKSMNEMHRSISALRGEATAPERYDAHVRMMEARLEGMKAVSDALPGLYAVLTEQQKHKADQLLGMGMM